MWNEFATNINSLRSHGAPPFALSRDRWNGNMKGTLQLSAGLQSRIWKTSSKARPLWSSQLMSVSEGQATWKQHRSSTVDQKHRSDVPHCRYLQGCWCGKLGAEGKHQSNSCWYICPSLAPGVASHYTTAKRRQASKWQRLYQSIHTSLEQNKEELAH